MRRSTLLLASFCLALWLSPPVAGGGAKRPLAELIADLKKGEKEQMPALQELEALGAKASEAVPALIELLANKSEDVRLGAAIVLGKIGPAAVEPLKESLAATDEDVRFFAVSALAFVGPPARSAAPALVKALADKSAQVRRKAAYALGRINPDPDVVAAALVAALAD